MKSYWLLQYVENRLHSIEQHLCNYIIDKNDEHLHDLRVEIKKIKSIFGFIKFFDSKIKLQKMLQGLFHAAGEIRALQLNIQLILETENVPAQVIDEYKDAEKMLIKVFIKNIPYFLESLKIFTQSIALPENFPEKNIINAYFEKIYKQANNLLKQPNRIKMHLFRKKIKALMYFHNALPQQSIRHIKFNSTSIDQLQESAGKWHDLYNAFIFFRFSNYATLLTENITELKRREKKSYAALSKTLRFKAD